LHLFGSLRFQVIVEEHNRRQRRRLGRKESDPLLNSIFQDAEFILPKISNQIATTVLYRDGDDNQFGSNGDGGPLVPRGLLPRRLRSLRRLRLRLLTRSAGGTEGAGDPPEWEGASKKQNNNGCDFP
jgi:hypothetical protein